MTQVPGWRWVHVERECVGNVSHKIGQAHVCVHMCVHMRVRAWL